MYVSAKINSQSVRALLDTGATHNFVSVDEAKRLGLKATKEGGEFTRQANCGDRTRRAHYAWDM